MVSPEPLRSHFMILEYERDISVYYMVASMPSRTIKSRIASTP